MQLESVPSALSCWKDLTTAAIVRTESKEVSALEGVFEPLIALYSEAQKSFDENE